MSDRAFCRIVINQIRFMSTRSLLYPNPMSQVNKYLKKDGDGGNSVVLVREEREEEESVELDFCYSHF